ncbi:hypothetical protein [Glutamicibacter soli]|uniref:hypothetical protein n=1 Tax=Glutamicibacter soli TaxID=453836 RepID=UPI00192A0B0A|nr:hypothetical protein [Glutamicibacter soli]
MDPQLPLRILEAVRLLHRLGYRGLRILPGLNASGIAWRIIIFNVTEWRTGDEFGAPYNAKESCRYTTADENVFNESIQFPADVSHIDVAEAIIGAMPSLKRSGFEETGNRAYVDWYSQLMSQVSKLTDLPIAYGDYGDFDEAWGWVWEQPGISQNHHSTYPNRSRHRNGQRAMSTTYSNYAMKC